MKNMIIEASQPCVTLINVFKVEPARQAELVALLQQVTDEVMCRQPGFIGASLHASLDGKQVVNYVQWASRDAFETALRKPEARAHIEVVEKIAYSVSPILHRVESVHRAKRPGEP